jgi:hypothetical protein
METGTVKLKFCVLFLLALLFADSIQAQGTGSVVIYNRSRTGTNGADVISGWLSAKIGEGLHKQYPCVDWIDNNGIDAILENERQRQLLGQDPDDEKLMNLAGALGARYIITVSATALPNGQTSISAKVIHSRTLRALINKSEMTAGGDDALDKAEAMAQQVMQGLAGVFKSRCEPHWTGTVSQVFRTQRGGTKELDCCPGAMEGKVKGSVSYSETTEHRVDAFLQPNSLGTEGTKTLARVTNLFNLNYQKTVTRTSTIRCRPGNAPSYEKQTNGYSKEIETESGRNTETMPAYIYVYKSSGRFEISVDYPATKTKRREESSGVKSGCTDEPFSEVKESDGSGPISEPYRTAGSVKITGKIDPKNPDVLVGQEITGEEEFGQYITKWNLRLVQSGSKK